MRTIIEAADLTAAGSAISVPKNVPRQPGIYGLLYRGAPGSPSLHFAEGALIRIGSATRDIRTRLRPLGRILRWDGFSEIRGDLRHGGLPDWLTSLPNRPKPEDFCIALAYGAHPQNAERLTYMIARDLTGSPPPANRCAPAIYQKPELDWLSGRAEGGTSLAKSLLGGDLFDQWLAGRT